MAILTDGQKHINDTGAPMLLKDISGTLQDIDKKQGEVSVFLNALGNLDSDGDRIRAGAYEKTIEERGPEGAGRIKFLWQHDPWEPIGKVLELREDPAGPGPEGGLFARVQVQPTARGRDALILYEGGVLTEHSVGIDILRRSEEDRSDVLEVRLWEGSVVTWGANALTPMVDLKSESPSSVWARLSDHMAKMRKALREPLTDETAETLELALHTMEGQIKQIENRLAPPEGTQDEPDFGKLLDDLVDNVTKAPAETAPPEGTQADAKSADGTPQSMEAWLERITEQL